MLLTQHGYRLVFSRENDLTEARVRLKAFGTKLEGVRADLSGVTDTHGNRLGIQVLGAVKDVQGAIYQHYLARDPEYLAEG